MILSLFDVTYGPSAAHAVDFCAGWTDNNGSFGGLPAGGSGCGRGRVADGALPQPGQVFAFMKGESILRAVFKKKEMKAKIKMLVLLAFAALLPAVPAHPAFAGRVVPGDVLVVFKNEPGTRATAASLEKGTGAFRIASLAASAGARVSAVYGALSEADGEGVFALLHSDVKSEDALAAELLARPDVLAASPNHVARLTDSRTPNDIGYSRLWGLSAIRAPEAWNVTTGSGEVYVAVIDTGVAHNHPDLRDNFSHTYSRNFHEDGSSGAYDDVHDHGTHVAGIIGAVGDNWIGVVGVNWHTKIIALRTMGSDGTGGISLTMSAFEHLTSILQSNPSLNLAAVNMSMAFYAGYTPDQMYQHPYWRAMSALDRTNRAIFAVAAGNEALEVGVPAPYDDPSGEEIFSKGDYAYPASLLGINNMISVAAVAEDLSFARIFSSWSRTCVGLAAPGVNIWSTVRNGSYASMRGTSMATPYVAGAAALLRSAYPNATGYQVKMALLQGANHNYFRDYTAYGFLDVKGALDYLSGNPGAHQDVPDIHEPDEPDILDDLFGSDGGGCRSVPWGISLIVLVLPLPLLRRKR